VRRNKYKSFYWFFPDEADIIFLCYCFLFIAFSGVVGLRKNVLGYCLLDFSVADDPFYALVRVICYIHFLQVLLCMLLLVSVEMM
jgi:hypothetical protein